MMDAPPPRYLTLLKAALLTAGVSLLTFGIAHMTFITWVVDRSEDPSLLLRLGLMLGAPMMIGAIPSVLAALLGAATWRATWGTPLATRRWGLAFVAGLLPALAANLVFGPSPEGPDPAVMFGVLGGVALLPALAGLLIARKPLGLLSGLAVLPVGMTLSLFIAAEALAGWTLAFVASIFAIFGASGYVMERVLARLPPDAPKQAISPGVDSTAP